MEKYEDKIKAHPVVKELMEVAKVLGYASSARLTGGAVVDILDGREPKDYDISWKACDGIHAKLGEHKDFKLLYESMTATTYLFKGRHKIQILKNGPETFPFLNDRILFKLDGRMEVKNNKHLRSILENRVIMVNDYRMVDLGIPRKLFKARVKKWESKGYKMHPITYKSYIKMTKHKSLFRKLVEVFAGSKSETES